MMNPKKVTQLTKTEFITDDGVIHPMPFEVETIPTIEESQKTDDEWTEEDRIALAQSMYEVHQRKTRMMPLVPTVLETKVGVKVLVEPIASGLDIPAIMTSGAAAADLRAALDEPVDIPPSEWRVITTGIRLEIPLGFEGQVRPRSGLAAHYGVTLLNSPGTIDSDYRGVVQVIMINHSLQMFTVNHGDRIAQLVIAPVTSARYVAVQSLEKTDRGNGGFGHTGV